VTARRDSRPDALVSNRKAFHDYTVLDRVEAGIQLLGSEVKSLKTGQASLAGAYATFQNGRALLLGVHIALYEQANRFNHDPLRPRLLLLHSREIRNLTSKIEIKGLSVIPLRMYLKKRWVKVELGICKGKKVGDKRESIRKKTADREALRAMRSEAKK